MKSQKRSIKAGSTQKFTEIKNIFEDIVIFKNSTACSIIEVQASNFALLSRQEQDTKIYSYAALLNSLSFPIQIIVRNKKIDISSYLSYLDLESKKLESIQSSQTSQDEPNKRAQYEGLSTYVKLYKDFIQELITVNTVLDKKFYIVIPYSYLEKGVMGATNAVKKGEGPNDSFFQSAKATLHTKAETLHSQIARLSLRAKTLEQDELIKLFYDIYNPNQTSSNDLSQGIKTPIVKMQNL